MPVLPEVGSRIVCPGSIAPSASAFSIIERATRSFTEPVGLWPSSLAKIRTSSFGERRLSSTRGVLPIDSTTSPKRPPQGLFKTGSGAMALPGPPTSESVARAGVRGATSGRRVARARARRQLPRPQGEPELDPVGGLGEVPPGHLLDLADPVAERVPVAVELARGPLPLAVMEDEDLQRAQQFGGVDRVAGQDRAEQAVAIELEHVLVADREQQRLDPEVVPGADRGVGGAPRPLVLDCPE